MIKKKGRKREAGEWHQRETGLSASPDIALGCAPVLLSMTIKKGKNMGTRRRRSKYKKMEPSPRRIREKRPKIFYVYCGSRDVTGFFFFIFISVRCIYCVDNNPISFDIIPCEQEERGPDQWHAHDWTFESIQRHLKYEKEFWWSSLIF